MAPIVIEFFSKESVLYDLNISSEVGETVVEVEPTFNDWRKVFE